LAKFAENCDHNIDPRWSKQVSGRNQWLFAEATIQTLEWWIHFFSWQSNYRPSKCWHPNCRQQKCEH
jgi:hypothetical protein